MNIYRDIPDVAELEREYSPSSCVDNLTELIQAYAERSADVREASPAMRTLRYGAHEDEVLDFFPVGSSHPAPLLAFIHGGYWQQLGKDDASFPAHDCRRNGIAYAAINYGLAPAATIAQMIERCRTALQYLYRQAGSLGVDRDSIVISGSSAGGHLAAMTLLTDWATRGLPGNPLRGAVFLSGVFDLEPLVHTYVNEPLGLDLAAAAQVSPLLRLADSSAPLPPVLLAYGENETAEFKRQSSQFAESLRRRAAAVELLCIAGRNHFDVVFDLADERTVLGRATLQFLGLHFRKEGEAS